MLLLSLLLSFLLFYCHLFIFIYAYMCLSVWVNTYVPIPFFYISASSQGRRGSFTFLLGVFENRHDKNKTKIMKSTIENIKAPGFGSPAPLNIPQILPEGYGSGIGSPSGELATPPTINPIALSEECGRGRDSLASESATPQSPSPRSARRGRNSGRTRVDGSSQHFPGNYRDRFHREDGPSSQRRGHRGDSRTFLPFQPGPLPGEPLENYPLYFVLRYPSSRLSDCDIIDVDGDLTRQVGPLDKVSIQKDGSLLVKASSASQSIKLSNLCSILGAKLDSKPHSSLNSSKATIYSKQLLPYTKERLLKGFKKKKIPVTDVYRFRRKVDSSYEDTPRLLLTFDTPSPPSWVKFGYLHIDDVRPYVSTPRRCFKCQRFGHTRQNCRSADDKCARCSRRAHGVCDAPPFLG